jgi:hypothetical protein
VGAPAVRRTGLRRARVPVVLTREDAYDGPTVPLVQYRLERTLS